MREIRRCDLLIWGGGQLLQDISSQLYIPFHIMRLALAVLMKKPTLIYSIGAGPIRSFFSRALTRIVVSRADTITVRDAKSADMLASCGIERDRIAETPDPALALRPDNDFDVEARLLEMGLDPKRPILGVAVRRLFHRKSGILPISLRMKLGLVSREQRARFDSFGFELARFIDYVVERYNFQVLFIPMYTEPGQNDQAVGRQIASTVQRKGDVFHLPPGHTSRQVLSIMSKTSAMLAVRMHAAVLSAVAGTPLICLHYAPKGASFMENIGLADYSLPVEDTNCGVLMRLFSKLMANRDAIVETMAGSVQASRSDVLLNVSSVKELLGMAPLGEEAVNEFLSEFSVKPNKPAERLSHSHADRIAC